MHPCPIRQAVVLCAGRGTRLGELGKKLPKAMLPVAGRALIAHIVEKLLTTAGFTQVVLVVGHRGEPVKQLFEDEPRVKIALQSSQDGTAHALLAAAHLLDDRFLLTYGDLWVARQDYRGLREAAETDGCSRMAMNHTERPRGAAIYLEGGRIVRVVEKPAWNGRIDTMWNAAGLYVLNKHILSDCGAIPRSSRGEFELTMAIQRAIDRGSRFVPYTLWEAQVDIGVPERYQALCASLRGISASTSPDSVANRITQPTRLEG